MNEEILGEMCNQLERIAEYLKPVTINQEHFHRHTIPVEWSYEADENIGGDYTKAAIVITSKRVTKLRCACGDEVER